MIDISDILKYASMIVNEYNHKVSNLDVTLKSFFDKYGMRMYLVLNAICMNELISFREKLLVARMFNIFYKKSDSFFSYYASRWVISSWTSAYVKAQSEEDKMQSLRLLYNIFSNTYNYKKQFNIASPDFYGISEKANDYMLYLNSREAERDINVACYLILFQITPILLQHYNKSIDTLYWNSLYAGKVYGEICTYFLRHKLNDYGALLELSNIVFEELKYQFYDNVDDPEYYIEFLQEKSKYDNVSSSIIQDMTDDDRMALYYANRY